MQCLRATPKSPSRTRVAHAETKMFCPHTTASVAPSLDASLDRRSLARERDGPNSVVLSKAGVHEGLCGAARLGRSNRWRPSANESSADLSPDIAVQDVQRGDVPKP